MSKLIPFLVLVLTTGSAFGAEPQFKNERAKKAEAAYQAALKEARRAYINELDQAIKEAGGAGDLDEANKMADVKEALEEEGKFNDRDPLALVRKKLENTTWKTPSNPKGFLRFGKANKTQNHTGNGGAWVVTDEVTALTQSHGTSNIYVFKFDEDLKTATVYTFVRSEKDKPRAYQRR